MKNIINLTPHPVRILDDDGNIIVEWESKGSLRIRYDFFAESKVSPTRKASIAGIDGLNLIDEGADVVIVSRAMAMIPLGLPAHVRVMYPDMEVRDPADPSRIIGCRVLTEIATDMRHLRGLQAVGFAAWHHGDIGFYLAPSPSELAEVYNSQMRFT